MSPLRRFSCISSMLSALAFYGVLIPIDSGELAAQEEAGVGEFVPMFSDAELTGWVRTNTSPETWSFRDGVLFCTGKPIGELRTERMYQNFIMELEWRHMVPAGNAGIFVWADDITSRGVPFHRGIEVQVLENAFGNNQSHTTHGDIFPIHGATMTPINGRRGSRAFPTENRSKPSPEWNHYRIECKDGAISLAVNGKVVTRGTACVPRKGYICIESEGGVVQYRNVKILELPSKDIPEEQIAIADRGYRSIYSGLNLDGWEADEGGAWSASDWVLSFRGEREESGKLSSDESVENIGFVVDVRFAGETSNAIIEAGPDMRFDLRSDRFSSELQPDNKWNRVEAWSNKGTPVVHLNGNPIEVTNQATLSDGTNSQASEASHLVLRPRGRVDFSNIYVRSFPAETSGADGE